MENLQNFLFFALLATTATFSTGSETPSTKYDITTLLNNSIAQSFQYMDSEFIEELVLSIENLNSTKFEKTTEYEDAPFEDKFYFTGINITLLDSQFVHVHRRFPSNLLSVFSQKLVIRIDAYLGATNDTVQVAFSRFVDFEDCSIMISRGMHVERLFDIYLIFENYTSHYANFPWFHPDIEPDSRIKLEQKIDELLPSILRDSLLKNGRFLRLLDSAFITHPEKEINSTYTDFANNTDQYHYFIPNITSLRRTLSNITLTGLHNFETHAFHVSLGRPISTLVIRNIEGNANLFYDSQHSTFPLRFKIFGLTIKVDKEKEFVDVRTYDYSVNETKSNESLNEYQSKWIMEGIQLAVASSIMPSIKVYRHRNQSTSTNGQHPVAKIFTTMSHQFREDIVQKLNVTRNTSVSSEPEMMRIKSNSQIESFQYNISIERSMEVLMSILRLVRIRCYPYHHLKMFFETKTNSSLFGRIILRNTTHVFDDIFFEVGSVQVYLSKYTNSNEDDDYELRTFVFFINLFAKRSTFDESQLATIEDKAEKMLASSIEKTLLPYAKSLLSSTLNFCTSPVKMFDDFLPFYANYELPYKVPDIDIDYENTTNTEELFVSKIHNVVMSEWDQFTYVYVGFPSSGDDKLLPIVNFELGKVNIRLNVNDTLFNFKELQVTNQELCLINGTDDGKIRAQFCGFYRPFRVPATNKSVSRRESSWFRRKLQYLIGKSFE